MYSEFVPMLQLNTLRPVSAETNTLPTSMGHGMQTKPCLPDMDSHTEKSERPAQARIGNVADRQHQPLPTYRSQATFPMPSPGGVSEGRARCSWEVEERKGSPPRAA